MKKNIKKMLPLSMAGIMVVGSIAPIFATVSDIHTVTSNSNQQTEVTYNQESNFEVTVPKLIDLGSDKLTNYTVGVTGDISSDEVIKVVPEESFLMKDVSGTANLKDDVTATVTQDKTEWIFNEFDVAGNGNVSAPDLTAGKWEGKFNFNIKLENLSEEEAVDLRAGLYDKEGNMLYSWKKNDAVLDSKKVNELLEQYPTTYRVIIPNMVTEIKYDTFWGENVIVEVPDSVTKFGEYCFRDVPLVIFHGDTCDELQKCTNGYHEDGLIYKDETKTTVCASMNTKTIIIPEGVTSIDSEEEAFSGLVGLEYIEIPSTVTYIEPDAFYNSYVKKGNFINNSSLDAENYNYWGLKFCDDYIDGMVITDNRIVETNFKDIPKNLIIPEGITSIDVSFDGTHVTNITIPSSVTYIDDYAFYGYVIKSSNFINNSSLNAEENNYWGASVYDEYIDGMYIKNNTIVSVNEDELPENVIVPEGITTIGKSAFSYDARKVKTIQLPSTLTTIESNAFSNCYDLTSINIPDNVKSIDFDAFSSCRSLSEIKIPASIEFIDTSAFSGCVINSSNFINNSSLDAEENNYWSAIVYDQYIDGMYIRDNSIVKANKNELPVNLVIPEGIEYIGEYMFSDTDIETVQLPNSLKTIDRYAFRSTKLTSVTIPENVVVIEDGSFEDCYFESSNFINNSSLDAEENNYWGAKVYDEYIDGMYIKNNVIISVNNKELPENVVIPEGVTSIADRVFARTSNLNTITIPSSVISIAEQAFYGCHFEPSNFINNSSLDAEENNYWGAKVYDEYTNGMYIRNNAIVATDSWELPNNVAIPEGITSIKKYAFDSCYNVTTIQLPNSLTTIEDYAFSYCQNLNEITIPEGVTTIGTGAFRSCYLTKITIPSTVAYIGEWAFEGNQIELSNFINNSSLNAEENNYWGAYVYE